MQFNTTDMDLKQNTVRFSPSARAKSFSLVFGIHFPERQFKVRKPNAFSQPVTTNRPAFLPAAAASQIYLPVLWKWPWLLDIHAAGSQRGREGGRSLFPGLQEVTLLLFLEKKKKAGVSSETPGYPCERAKHTHSPSAMVAKTHTTQGHWGRGGGGTTAKLEMIDFFKGNGSRWWEMFPGTTAEQTDKWWIYQWA